MPPEPDSVPGSGADRAPPGTAAGTALPAEANAPPRTHEGTGGGADAPGERDRAQSGFHTDAAPSGATPTEGTEVLSQAVRASLCPLRGGVAASHRRLLRVRQGIRKQLERRWKGAKKRADAALRKVVEKLVAHEQEREGTLSREELAAIAGIQAMVVEFRNMGPRDLTDRRRDVMVEQLWKFRACMSHNGA